MQDLNKIINESSLIFKRSLAIKMIKLDYAIEDVCDLIDVKKSFIEKWRAIYNREGVKHLNPKYKGSKGFFYYQTRKFNFPKLEMYNRFIL